MIAGRLEMSDFFKNLGSWEKYSDYYLIFIKYKILKIPSIYTYYFRLFILIMANFANLV